MNHFLRLFGLMVFGAINTVAMQAIAQTYPNKPIRYIVGFAAGGPTDLMARFYAQELSSALNQPVLIENRGGASGALALDVLQKSAPDGYTIMSLALPTVTNARFSGKPFDAMKEASPISLLYVQYNVVVVNNQAPLMGAVKSLPDLIAVARANPGKINFTSAGHGSTGHLTAERIDNLAGVAMTHIAYKGAGPALNDVLSGQVPVMYGDSASAKPHIKSGKLKPLAVSSSARQEELPDVPTFVELGFKDMVVDSWIGLVGPPGMPHELVDRLNAEVKVIVAKPAFRAKIAAAGAQAQYTTVAQTIAKINSDSELWGEVIRVNNLKPE